MCRWIFLQSSDDVQLSEIVLQAKHSMVHQSYNANFHPGFTKHNNATLNADGFGVGWYHTCSTFPACFKDIEPAWNNLNLRELCLSTKSNCILAHVRAASLGSVVSRENCHPFKYGRLLFCHNGHIENFELIKRDIQNSLSQLSFSHIMGTTDSENMFAMIVSDLKNPDRIEPFEPSELVGSLSNMILQIQKYIEKYNIVDGFTTLNCCLTDGNTVVVSRYCDKYPNIPPPSLYYGYTNRRTMYSDLVASSGDGTSTSTPGDGTTAHIQDNQKSSIATDEGTEKFKAEEEDHPKQNEKTTSIEEGIPQTQTKAVNKTSDETDPAMIDNDDDEFNNKQCCQIGSLVRGCSSVNHSDDYCFMVTSSPLSDSQNWKTIENSTILYCERGSKPMVVPIGI